MELAPRWIVLALISLLVAANTFIAADIAAMGDALSLVIGGLDHEHAVIFASTSTLLQVFVPYRRYAPVLKFLTLTVRICCDRVHRQYSMERGALLAAVWPKPIINTDYFLMVVAVLGTTISPHLFSGRRPKRSRK
jgi:Mn2+/Fe2+ NRAMP family transporter